MMNGIVVVDKAAGFTSHDVVAKMRGICGQRKIGHTGTLDPMATGVLPVCLGNATKLCDMLAEKDKEYVARLLLGMETDTQDVTGQVTARHSVDVTESQVQSAAEFFVGEYLQVPPMYSALKVEGRKLYELARAGKEVERKARPVVIRELEILDCSLPEVVLRVVCSKGTYIRTLCADIGERLGCGGTMKSLRRTRVGRFSLEGAYPLEEVQRRKDEGSLQSLVIPTESVFEGCPVIHASERACGLLDNGNALLTGQTAEQRIYEEGQWVRMHRPDGSFAGIYAYERARGWYRPVKMFLEKE